MPQILKVGLCLLVLTILSPVILLVAVIVLIHDWRLHRIPNDWHLYTKGGVSSLRRRSFFNGCGDWELKSLTAAECDEIIGARARNGTERG